MVFVGGTIFVPAASTPVRGCAYAPWGKQRTIVALRAVNGAVAGGAGAFAAHGLKEHLDPKALEVFESAARSQMYHALAMLLSGVASAGLRVHLPDRHRAVLRELVHA